MFFWIFFFPSWHKCFQKGYKERQTETLKPLWTLRSSFSVSCLQTSKSDSQNVFKLTGCFVCSVFTSREAIKSLSLIGTLVHICKYAQNILFFGEKPQVYLSCTHGKKTVLLRGLSLSVLIPMLSLLLVVIGWNFPKVGYSSQKRRER